MLKYLSVVILIVIISISLAFTLVKTASLGEMDNWFNSNYRELLAGSPFLRKVFALNFDGDAKTDYLSSKRERIVVEVDEVLGYEFKAESLEIASEEIRELLGKEVNIIRSSQIPKDKLVYSHDDLARIYEKYKIRETSANEAVFYIIYVPRNDGDEGLVGETIMEDGAVIYAEAITGLGTENIVEIEASTILHEFGHLLGLPHVEAEHCIMNETLEVGGRKQNIATEFCAEELRLLESIKLDIN